MNYRKCNYDQNPLTKCVKCQRYTPLYHTLLIPEYSKFFGCCDHCFIEYKENIQPERSKREDLSLKEIINILENALQPNKLVGDAYKELKQLLSELKMRCSEHCGNTMRDK